MSFNYIFEQEDRIRDAASSESPSIPVTALYLSELFGDDDQGLLITTVDEGCRSGARILLQLQHPDNFGILKLELRGPKFHLYFNHYSTVKVNDILLKKATHFHQCAHDGDWEIVSIKTENRSDCHYLFQRAISDNFTVVLAMLLEIIDANHSSRQLVLYPHNDNGTPLHRAVIENDINIIETLLHYKLDVNAKNKSGWTPLHVAVDLEVLNIVDFLINNGADVNALTNDNQVPLHFAARKNNSNLLLSLFKNQAKLDTIDTLNQSPLFYAVAAGNADIVDIFLRVGANTQLQDTLHYTPFDLAVQQKNLDIIEIFLNNNINVDIVNSLYYLSETSFHPQPTFVNKETYEKVINFLLAKGANINLQSLHHRTPLQHAVINDNVECLQVLLACKANIKVNNKSCETLLHLAFQYNAKKCFQILLDSNIDINAVDIANNTVLQMAVNEKKCDFIELILKKYPNIDMSDGLNKKIISLAIESESLVIMELILKNNVNVNSKDASGKTALHLVLESGLITMINILLENGADVNLKDGLEKNALHLASERPYVTVEIIKSILNSINDIDAKDILRRTAVYYAVLNNNFDTLKCLLEAHADINIEDFEGKSPLHVTMAWENEYVPFFRCIIALINHKANINAVDNDFTSLLHLACFNKNTEIIKYLIKNGADSSIRDKHDRTVFHYACMIKLNEISRIDNIEEHVKDTLNILFEENISVNCVDKNGKTPLHYVIENKSFFMCEPLLNLGSDINILDNNNNSPIDKLMDQNDCSSEYNSDNEIVTLFKRHIIKMKMLNLWVRKSSLDIVYKKGSKCVKLFEDDCRKEIDLMINTKFLQNNVTYYDFLSEKPCIAVTFALNNSIVKAIQSDELKAMFPIYWHFFKSHLREAQRQILL